VQPASVNELSTIIKTLTRGVNGDKLACKFAVKSGGHSPFLGMNDIDGGISVDLRNLNSTTIAADESYVSLSTGSRWRDVYAVLDDTGITIPGAECSDTGVGGVILGGGISFFFTRVGFVADNVLAYEVVLASGDIVNANGTDNSDLHMALQGGLNNFGIVSRFDVAAFENGKVWGGGITNPATGNNTAIFLKALSNLTDNNHKDPYAAYGTLFSYNTSTNARVIVHTIVYTKDIEHPEIFQPFESITPQLANSLRTTTVGDLTNESSAFMPVGYRDLDATVAFKNSIAAINLVHNITNGIYNKVSRFVLLAYYSRPEPPSTSTNTFGHL